MAEQKPVIELELYLIRHGQTHSNACPDEAAELPVCDREDPFLTPKGQRQAELLGEKVADIDFDAVYSSCLRRAVQTAGEIVLRQSKSKPLFMHPVFTECGLSKSYHGCSVKELREICSAAVLAEGVDPSGELVMRDEPDEDCVVQQRAAAAIDYLRSRYKNGEKVAVVLHAAFLTNIVFYLMGFTDSMPSGVDISFENTGVTRITFYKHGTFKFGDTVFEYINDTSHLAQF